MDGDAAGRVLAACPIVAWEGLVWRVHPRIYPADSPGGSLRAQGRWHRGGRSFPADQVFAALYLSAAPDVAAWELIRNSRRPDADEMWLRFAAVDETTLRVRVQAILDLREPSVAGLSVAELVTDEYALTQAIGGAAFRHGLEGLLATSATGMGGPGHDYNLVIFPDNLRPGSEIVVLESKTPKLPRAT